MGGEKPAEAKKAQDLKKGRETAQQIGKVPGHMSEGGKGTSWIILHGEYKKQGHVHTRTVLAARKIKGDRV